MDIEKYKFLDVDNRGRHHQIPEIGFDEAKVLRSQLARLFWVVFLQLLVAKREDQAQTNQPAHVQAIIELSRFSRVRCFQSELKLSSGEQWQVDMDMVKVGRDERICE